MSREQNPSIPPGLLGCKDGGDEMTINQGLYIVGLKLASMVGILGLRDTIQV